jgi:hypothetical protein
MDDVPIALEVDQEKKEVTIGVDVDGDRKVDINIKLIITDRRFWYIVIGVGIAVTFVSKLGGLW